MEKQVYLFELDSVRNSAREKELGKKKLFEEIFLNNNQVILTFNQLTDSKAFLGILENEDDFYNIIELFKCGAIKISLYKGYRTASQYIIQALERCLKAPYTSDKKEQGTERSGFVFSAWPIDKSDKELLGMIHSAFCYRDFGILEERLKQKRESFFTDEQISDMNDLDKVIKYMKLIDALDTHDINYIAPRPDTDKIKTFSEYLGDIFEYYLTEKARLGNISEIPVDEDTLQRFNSILEFLKNDLWESFETDTAQRRASIKQIDKRSKCYEKIDESDLYGKDKLMAKAVLDMCSNYTTEGSINGLVPHIDTDNTEEFFKDFEKLFIEYLSSHIEENSYTPENARLDWAVAARFAEEEKIRLPRIMAAPIDLFCERFQKRIKKHIRKNLIYRTISILLYSILWLVVSFAIDLTENFISDKLDIIIEISGWAWAIEFIISPLIMLVIFGLISSWISEKCKLHDILESVVEVRTAISDARYYKKYKKLSEDSQKRK
ncbi:MAG: hypothetical protein J6C89_05235 [Clostridia bacterium]|nr:hypothetical protein [Clostridia bacterium]